MSASERTAVSPVQIALGAAGVALAAWGVWLLVDDEIGALVSVAIWLIGGVVVHDAILAPLTVGVTVLGARFLPPAARMPATVAFVVWATCSIAFFAVLSGQGGKTGNDTILGRPYELTWLIFTVVLVVAAAVAAVIRTRRS